MAFLSALSLSISDIMGFIERFGVQTTLLLFFIWVLYTTNKRNDEFIRTQLMKMVGDTQKTLQQNTAVLRNVTEILNSRPCIKGRIALPKEQTDEST